MQSNLQEAKSGVKRVTPSVPGAVVDDHHGPRGSVHLDASGRVYRRDPRSGNAGGNHSWYWRRQVRRYRGSRAENEEAKESDGVDPSGSTRIHRRPLPTRSGLASSRWRRQVYWP